MYSETETRYSDRPSQLIWKLSRAEYQQFFCTQSFSSGVRERQKSDGCIERQRPQHFRRKR